MATQQRLDPVRQSSYLNYLPAMFQEDALVSSFLLAFEQILSGQETEASTPPGLEARLDQIYCYFNPLHSSSDPAVAPLDFLPWLASWVALGLQDDWTEETKRRFIRNVVPLYKKRGTKAGLKELLELYTQTQVQIEEFEQPPHYFQIKLTLTQEALNKQPNLLQTIKTLIDREKPAHTFYALIPSFQGRMVGGDNT